MFLDTEQRLIVAGQLTDIGDTIEAHIQKCIACGSEACEELVGFVEDYNKIARTMNKVRENIGADWEVIKELQIG